jgi:hypothetical protein
MSDKNVKIANGFIFNSKLDEVVLITTDQKIWTGFKCISEENENIIDKLNTKIKEYTNQTIKQESWRQASDLINLEKTWSSTIYMTVTSNLENFCIPNDNCKIRIFRISSLDSNQCPISILWKIYLCLDTNIHGSLSRIVYYV